MTAGRQAPCPRSLAAEPWTSADLAVPADVLAVPAMLFTQERRMLFHLARHFFSGQGAIADMGSYLGGSTLCFAAGLRQRSFDRPVIHTYDLFKLASAVFLLTREVPREVLEACRYMAIPMDEKLALMDRAINRLDSPAKRRYLLENRRLLMSGEDEIRGLHYHEL